MDNPYSYTERFKTLKNENTDGYWTVMIPKGLSLSSILDDAIKMCMNKYQDTKQYCAIYLHVLTFKIKVPLEPLINENYVLFIDLHISIFFMKRKKSIPMWP